MRKNWRRKQMVQIGSMLMAVVVVSAAHAITAPIQTPRGVVRLGSKTQANVDANRSSVALGQGMVMVSSNPGGLGRPAIGVSFNGAPMFAKVQGTALVAYLPGAFIEITGVEGRTYLFRKGSFGENVAIDAGKMLLVKPAANRLPDTADVNLDYLVKHSPMLKGGVNLAAWPLVASAIDKQSKNHYLKATSIYFDGAGTEALVAGKKGEVPSGGESVGVERKPVNTSLTATEAVEQIPRRFAPEQLLASLSSTGSTGVTTGGGGGGGGGGGEPTSFDLPGAPQQSTVTLNSTDIVPTRGFLEEFSVSVRPAEDKPFEPTGTRVWFPPGFPDVEGRSIMAERLNLRNKLNLVDPNLVRLTKGERSGLIQGAGAQRVGAGQFPFLIFEQAKINDKSLTFTITPFRGVTQIELRVSKDDVPSDLLTKNEFRQAFAVDGIPPDKVDSVNLGYKKKLPGGTFDLSNFDVTFQDINNFPPLQDTPATMKIEVPPQGLKYSWNDFFNQPPTKPTKPDALIAADGQLLGLQQDTLMGSAFVHVTGGAGVTVEVGNRTGNNALQFRSNDTLPGIFSLQAPPPTGSLVKASILDTTPSFRIQSDGPLQISDPGPRVLTSVEVVSKQDVGVRSTSSDGELVLSKAALHAGRAITVSSAKRIRFENSSQLNALTAVVMQGAGTAGLEVVNSTVNTPQGQVLIDQFNRIQMDSAQLTASVIKARVIGPDGVLQITNSTLSAGTLLRLYAEGYRGTVEFAGAVKLGGHTIDIAGDTVRVKANGSVTWTNPNATATVYANTRDYNKAGFGTMENHQQKPFGARPPF